MDVEDDKLSGPQDPALLELFELFALLRKGPAILISAIHTKANLFLTVFVEKPEDYYFHLLLNKVVCILAFRVWGTMKECRG